MLTLGKGTTVETMRILILLGVGCFMTTQAVQFFPSLLPREKIDLLADPVPKSLLIEADFFNSRTATELSLKNIKQLIQTFAKQIPRVLDEFSVLDRILTDIGGLLNIIWENLDRIPSQNMSGVETLQSVKLQPVATRLASYVSDFDLMNKEIGIPEVRRKRESFSHEVFPSLTEKGVLVARDVVGCVSTPSALWTQMLCSGSDNNVTDVQGV